MDLNKIQQPHKSSLGNLNANVVAIFCYCIAIIFSLIPDVRFVAWSVPLFFFLSEKDSVLVKFHAMQAFVINIIGAILSLLLVSFRGLVNEILTSVLKRSYSFNFNVPDIVYSIFTIVIVIFILLIAVPQIIAIFKAKKFIAFPIPLISTLVKKISNKWGLTDFDDIVADNTPKKKKATNSAPAFNSYAPVNYPSQNAAIPPAQPTPPPADAPRFDPQTGQPLNPGNGQ